MLVFKQIAKFEYQLACDERPALDIILLPNNTVSNTFSKVTETIAAMSAKLGKEFDEYIFEFVDNYRKCDTEKDKYDFLEGNATRISQFATNFVASNDVNYQEFADENKRTEKSEFLDCDDIIKIAELSSVLKIYSLVLNTELGIAFENKKKLYNLLIDHLKAICSLVKLHKFLKIISYGVRERFATKNAIYENVISRMLDALNFIAYNGMLKLDHKSNPVPYFNTILFNYIFEYEGKYSDNNEYTEEGEEVEDKKEEPIEDVPAYKNSVERNQVDNIYIAKLFYLGLSHLAYKRQVKKHLFRITQKNPFWDFILSAVLSKLLKVSDHHLRNIASNQATVISYYLGVKLTAKFYRNYNNLFGLSFLYPLSEPKNSHHRLKNVSKFIHLSHKFGVFSASSQGTTPRIFIVRVLEKFIGQIKSMEYAYTSTGDKFGKIDIEKIEPELIDFFIRLLVNDFEREFKEIRDNILDDFERQNFFKNVAKKYSPEKSNGLKNTGLP